MNGPLLVTGGAGFIGANFARHAIARGDTVVNLDKLTYAGNLGNLAPLRDEPRHVFVAGDIADRPLLRALFSQHRPRAVVHFAAESHVDRSIDTPSPCVATNIDGSFALLEESLAWWRTLPAPEQSEFRFLQVSTDEVFGSIDNGAAPVNEAAPFRPSSPYAASKAAADHLARAWHRSYGLPVLIPRCSNSYGPLQFPEKLIPYVIVRALAGDVLPLYGDGLQRRDWLHVADHCRAVDLVLARAVPGAEYNVGSGEEHTNLHVAHALCTELDWQHPDAAGPYARLIAHVADRPGHDRRYALDCHRLRADLGWAPRIDFASGLADTVRWYLQHGDWQAHIADGSYRHWRDPQQVPGDLT